uniref:rhotekin-2 n=1 Tax=Euleptes europaea TaxID=460621 RepID=UPI0025420E62|nr:rhotekin-2 [Euleptes europaea]
MGESRKWTHPRGEGAWLGRKSFRSGTQSQFHIDRYPSLLPLPTVPPLNAYLPGVLGKKAAHQTRSNGNASRVAAGCVDSDVIHEGGMPPRQRVPRTGVPQLVRRPRNCFGNSCQGPVQDPCCAKPIRPPMSPGHGTALTPTPGHRIPLNSPRWTMKSGETVPQSAMVVSQGPSNWPGKLRGPGGPPIKVFSTSAAEIVSPVMAKAKKAPSKAFKRPTGLLRDSTLEAAAANGGGPPRRLGGGGAAAAVGRLGGGGAAAAVGRRRGGKFELRRQLRGVLGESGAMRRCRETGGFASAGLQSCSIQEKIEFEMRMQEGICKLLAVTTQKDQTLHAVKNLMVCNARILAYKTELQRQQRESVNRNTGRCSDFVAKDREACKGKVAISDLRIPLMWKDSDHFSNKDRTQRYSVFCLFKIGAQVFDTDLLIVDKAITDICFESVTVFEEVGPDFQLKVEVYSCCCTEDSSVMLNTPKKLVKKLKTSIGKATGKKLSSTSDDGNPESLLLSDMIVLGEKYNLLAHATLGLESVEDNFKTHNLTIVGNKESSFWLPLYGSMCCRLAAQPSCMTKNKMAGFLNQQQMIGKLTSWRRLYCVLRGGELLCYYTPEEIEAKVEPSLTIPVSKETRIRAVDKDSQKKAKNFSIIYPEAGEAVTQIFAVENQEDLSKWTEAFWQHFYDFSQWKHCCEEFMKIEIMSPRKPPLFLTKEATSVYQDMCIDSPVKHEGLIDIVQRKIEETNGKFLVGQQEQRVLPLWAAKFDVSHQMFVQKNRIPGTNKEIAHPNESKGTKRRAPLPPSDKPLYSSAAQTPSTQLDKENIGNNSPLTRRACSFDSGQTSFPHLQRPIVAPRKSVTCRKGTFTDDETPVSSIKPVPAPRQK